MNRVLKYTFGVIYQIVIAHQEERLILIPEAYENS